MNILLNLPGHLVVDHMSDSLDVETSSSNSSGHNGSINRATSGIFVSSGDPSLPPPEQSVVERKGCFRHRACINNNSIMLRQGKVRDEGATRLPWRLVVSNAVTTWDPLGPIAAAAIVPALALPMTDEG